MADVTTEDHLVGVELQIVELVERRERATVQGRPDEARRIQAEIEALHAEMARTAEEIAEEPDHAEIHAPAAADVA